MEMMPQEPSDAINVERCRHDGSSSHLDTGMTLPVRIRANALAISHSGNLLPF
jgi:hypothetical protein